jgi:hypothetical protein
MPLLRSSQNLLTRLRESPHLLWTRETEAEAERLSAKDLVTPREYSPWTRRRRIFVGGRSETPEETEATAEASEVGAMPSEIGAEGAPPPPLQTQRRSSCSAVVFPSYFRPQPTDARRLRSVAVRLGPAALSPRPASSSDPKEEPLWREPTAVASGLSTKFFAGRNPQDVRTAAAAKRLPPEEDHPLPPPPD